MNSEGCSFGWGTGYSSGGLNCEFSIKVEVCVSC
jgi:hypothetical protein